MVCPDIDSVELPTAMPAPFEFRAPRPVYPDLYLNAATHYNTLTVHVICVNQMLHSHQWGFTVRQANIPGYQMMHNMVQEFCERNKQLHPAQPLDIIKGEPIFIKDELDVWRRATLVRRLGNYYDVHCEDIGIRKLVSFANSVVPNVELVNMLPGQAFICQLPAAGMISEAAEIFSNFCFQRYIPLNLKILNQPDDGLLVVQLSDFYLYPAIDVEKEILKQLRPNAPNFRVPVVYFMPERWQDCETLGYAPPTRRKPFPMNVRIDLVETDEDVRLWQFYARMEPDDAFRAMWNKMQDHCEKYQEQPFPLYEGMLIFAFQDEVNQWSRGAVRKITENNVQVHFLDTGLLLYVPKNKVCRPHLWCLSCLPAQAFPCMFPVLKHCLKAATMFYELICETERPYFITETRKFNTVSYVNVYYRNAAGKVVDVDQYLYDRL